MRIIQKDFIESTDFTEGDFLVVDNIERRMGFAFASGFLVEESCAEIVDLSEFETKLLEFLFENRGSYVTIKDIGKNVWNKRVSEQNIRNFINSLRKATCAKFIVNKLGEGYMIPNEE